MPGLTDKLAADFTEHGVDLLRVGTATNRRVQALLRDLEKEIVGRLRQTNLTSYAESRLRNLLADVRRMTSAQFESMATVLDEGIRELAGTSARVAASVVNTALGADLLDGVLPRATLRSVVSETLIQGAPSAEWWSRQAADLAFRFSQQIRLGMSAGETVGQMVGRVTGMEGGAGILFQTRRNVEALVRTSVLTVGNDARLAAYRKNADVIKGVQQISTLDDRTTDVCMAYDHATWNLDGEPTGDTTLPFDGGPPRHWNCRSVLVPITKSWKELGAKNAKEVPASVRAGMDGKVASETSFGDWLNTRSVEQQNEMLGAGRAQLWREDKISLSDLLDQRGNPLSLGQLQRKYGLN